MQWIYTEYFNIYSQYLSYFTTVIILLTTTTALSLIKSIDDNNKGFVKAMFGISFAITIIDVYIVFDIYNGIRTMLLLMSSKCSYFNGNMACDVNIQEQSTCLTIAIILAIISFILMITGYYFKIRGKNVK
jgi:hypothetical protein